MADVIVRGMEMPEFCDECGCKRRTQRGACCGILGKPLKTSRNYKRDDDCPLHPLPEKHGRLGDLDALSESLAESATFNYNKRVSVTWADAFETMVDILEDADTIVPAEGGGEDAE